MRHLLICLSLFLTTTCFGNVNVKPLPGMPFVNRTHPLSRGLVGLWLFNEGTGNKVFDLSGNNHTGTFIGTAPSWNSGKYGSAVFLPGTDEYIDCGSAIIPVNDFTIIASGKRNVTDAFFTIVSQWKSGDAGRFDLGLSNNANYNNLKIYIGGALKAQSSAAILTEQFHVAYTQDSSNAIKLYVNGKQDGSGAGLNIQQATNTLIGSYSLGEFFNGLFDYVIIYNRALSASEIALLKREPFCFMQGAPVPMYAEEAPPAGGGQVIMIQMTAIPLAAILSITLALVFSRRRK